MTMDLNYFRTPERLAFKQQILGMSYGEAAEMCEHEGIQLVVTRDAKGWIPKPANYALNRLCVHVGQDQIIAYAAWV